MPLKTKQIDEIVDRVGAGPFRAARENPNRPALVRQIVSAYHSIISGGSKSTRTLTTEQAKAVQRGESPPSE